MDISFQDEQSPMLFDDKAYYLATPYTNYGVVKGGLTDAYTQACRFASELMRWGYIVHSPIVHSHPISQIGGFMCDDHYFWMRQDRPMMEACKAGLIVACMDGWQESRGVAEEIDFFRKAARPIFYVYEVV